MPDLATLRRTDATRFTGRIWREVVVVHVALGRDGVQRVDLLFHLEHVQCGDSQDLGLSALEDRRAVNARDDRNFGVERTDLRLVAAVDANAVGENAVTHNLFGDRLVSSGNLTVGFGGQVASLDLGGDGCLDAVLQCVVGVLALDLVGDLVDTGEFLFGQFLDGGEGLVAVVREHGVGLDFLRRLCGELLLGANEFRDVLLRRLEALLDDCLVGLDATGLDEVPRTLGRFGLHHHDGDVFRTVLVLDDATGDDEVEDGFGHLCCGRERDPVSVDENHADTGDRSRERETRDLGRCRRGVDCECVVVLARCDRENGDDNLDLVTQAVDERRTQRAVDQTADEDRFGRRATFTTEERAGDFSRGIRTLFDVNREREEVKPFTRLLAGARRAQDHCFLIEVGGNGTLCLLRQTARFKTDDSLAELTVIDNGLGELDFRTFHRSLLLYIYIPATRTPCGRGFLLHFEQTDQHT